MASISNSHSGGPEPQHHVTKLADGGVGQNPLDVSCHQPHRGGKDSRNPADDGYRGCCLYRMGEEGEGTGDQKDAGRDHCSRVNQGADRCRAFHSVG